MSDGSDPIAPRIEPRFSVVTPVYAPQIDVLEQTIASVLAQHDTSWELLLVDDASPDRAVVEFLKRAARDDPRIRVIERSSNGHIVAASNDGVAAASGEFIALLDHDDLLTPNALSTMAHAIERHPDVDYLYSDEDKVTADGRSYDLFAKPDWSPERLRGQMYTGHLSVLRTSVVREVGGFHEGFEGSQDHDLVLRVTERARRVVHVPEVLYHWRAVEGSTAGSGDAKPYAWTAGVRAVQAHLDRVGVAAQVEPGRQFGTYRVNRTVSEDHTISVVIPTRGSIALVRGEWRRLVVDAVRSIVERGGHQGVEVVVVHDTQTDPTVLEDLRAVAGEALTLVPYGAPFNFSQKCNLGALAARGDLLAFVNDDVELISQDFLVALCGPLSEPDVGLTGAKLLYADTTIQHAGLAFRETHFYHALQGRLESDPGPFNVLEVSRECSGLTAAAVACRRSVFDALGGFSEALPNNFNDVDLSLKARSLGFRNVWLNDAVAFHFESQTRQVSVHKWEQDIIRSRWGDLGEDPFLLRDKAHRVRLRNSRAGRAHSRSDARRDKGERPSFTSDADLLDHEH